MIEIARSSHPKAIERSILPIGEIMAAVITGPRIVGNFVVGKAFFPKIVGRHSIHLRRRFIGG